jgi:trigger factor
MQIAFQDTEKYTKLLTITVSPEDYKSKVEAELKRLKKTLKLPGFRPGTVPEDLIRRRFGKSIVEEEVTGFFRKGIEEGLAEIGDRLGEVRPTDKQKISFDVYNLNKTYQYIVEAAPAPKVELPDLNTFLPTFKAYKMAVLDEHVDLEIESFRGKNMRNEVVQEGVIEAEDYIYYGIIALNADNTPIETELSKNGAIHLAELAPDMLLPKMLVGNGVKEEVIIEDIWADVFYADKEETASELFGTTYEEAVKISSRFKFTVEKVERSVIPSVEKILEDPIFADFVFKTEDDLRLHYKKLLEENFGKQSKTELGQRVEIQLTKQLKITLPDMFLVNWIWERENMKEREKGKLSKGFIPIEAIAQQYPYIAYTIKNDLIHKTIIEEQELGASREEIEEELWSEYERKYPRTAGYILRYIMDKAFKEDMANQQKVEEMAKQVLQKKVINWLAEQVNTEPKEVTVEEFYASWGKISTPSLEEEDEANDAVITEDAAIEVATTDETNA